MATKLGNAVTHHKELLLINLLDPSITWFCEVTSNIKYFISPFAPRPMATKRAKVVTCLEGLSVINSHNPLNMCSREVTWQIKNIISPMSQCLWPQDLSGW